MEQQICKICDISKDLTKDNFELGSNKRNGIITSYWYKTCKECDRPRMLAKNQRYKNKNRKILAEKQREYHSNNKENDAKSQQKWYQNNKEKVRKRVKIWMANKRNSNPSFRLKESISTMVRTCIKKNNKSFIKFVPYTAEELKQHLENQFESWMTWNNYGKYYSKIWDDNDQSTWTWQLDHIIPHSKFKYSSMEDEEFKKCWSLDNLRPLSSKQNLQDGNRR